MSDLNLSRLAELLKARNTVEKNIANIIGRSVNTNNVGDTIAAAIFDIALSDPGYLYKSSDGRFLNGPLAGKSVAIEWYPRRDGQINLKIDAPIDYYLVLAGPKTSETLTQNYLNPWVIESVHLFDARELLAALRERGVQIGTGTSVIAELWDRAEIHPKQRNPTLELSEEQRRLLALFH